MPELPEVETVKRAMAEAAEGGVITKIWTSGHKMRWPIPHDIEERLVGSTIHGLRRRGKYIIMETGPGTSHRDAAIIHLGMSGSIRIYPSALIVDRKKHDHMVIEVKRHKKEMITMVLNDPRRFGGVQITGYGCDHAHPLIRNMGIEPLGNALSGEMMKQAFAHKVAPIKSVLLDQRVIAGIGNIYASEALYLAKISPRRKAKNVSRLKLDALSEAIRQVLSQAIEAGGTSLRDHVQPGGEIGYFVQQLNVYGREGDPCKECSTDIRMIRQTGRASFYCPSCQR